MADVRMIVSVAALGLAGGAAFAAVPQQHPSFDCARATSRAERLVCADPGLAATDRNLSEVYGRLARHTPPRERPALLAAQRAWLRQRDACTDEACLTRTYDARSSALWSQLDRRDRTLRAGVARVGQCQVTRIESIGPRLDTGSTRPDDSGTSVSFANGVYQVSYELEAPVARSRVGDPVKLCLASIPTHCPPGDDRGRWYTVTNLRTHQSWKMPDAQHMCGGA